MKQRKELRIEKHFIDSAEKIGGGEFTEGVKLAIAAYETDNKHLLSLTIGQVLTKLLKLK